MWQSWQESVSRTGLETGREGKKEYGCEWLLAVTGKMVGKAPVTQAGYTPPFFSSDPPVALEGEQIGKNLVVCLYASHRLVCKHCPAFLWAVSCEEQRTTEMGTVCLEIKSWAFWYIDSTFHGTYGVYADKHEKLQTTMAITSRIWVQHILCNHFFQLKPATARNHC